MFAVELRVPRSRGEGSFDKSESAQSGGRLGVFELADGFFLAAVFQGGYGRRISKREGLLQHTGVCRDARFQARVVEEVGRKLRVDGWDTDDFGIAPIELGHALGH